MDPTKAVRIVEDFITWFEEDPGEYIDRTIIGTRYWNANGFATAVVAVRGGVDWAAYIGATPGDGFSQQETFRAIALFGSKLSRQQALAFFPDLEGAAELAYRY